MNATRKTIMKVAGVPWEPTEAERAYNEDRSTQIPVNPVLRVKGRFSRRLRDKDRELVLERCAQISTAERPRQRASSAA